MVSKGVGVVVSEGTAGYRGVRRCGRVWLCPVCAPRIRQVRSEEIGRALVAAVEDGAGVALLTMTVGHRQGDGLGWLFGESEAMWKAVQQHWSWRQLSLKWGMVGLVTFREVTHGQNGWHPHRHAAVVFRRPYGHGELQTWGGEVARLWGEAASVRGLRTGYRAVDVRQGSSRFGEYLKKVEGVGVELARGDLKVGRGTGWTPEQLGQRFTADADPAAADLLREYASVTTGRRMVTWSRTLKRYRAGVELTDKEIVDEDQGGELVAMLTARAWWRVVSSGRAAEVLEAAELGEWELGQALDELCPSGSWWLEREEGPLAFASSPSG
jgi:hypothetical protein